MLLGILLVQSQNLAPFSNVPEPQVADATWSLELVSLTPRGRERLCLTQDPVCASENGGGGKRGRKEHRGTGRQQT